MGNRFITLGLDQQRMETNNILNNYAMTYIPTDVSIDFILCKVNRDRFRSDFEIATHLQIEKADAMFILFLSAEKKCLWIY